jgi:hypothetical protein
MVEELAKLPASRRQKNCSTCCLFLGMLFYPENEGSIFLRNVSKRLPGYMRNIPEDIILQSHRQENLSSNIILFTCLSVTLGFHDKKKYGS